MFTFSMKLVVAAALALGAGVFALATHQGGKKLDASNGPPLPPERLRVHAKVVDDDKDSVPATRGALAETIVQRGSLHAVESTDLVCRVRTGSKDSIKWVIDDGSPVKKGDKLIELDSSAHLELLRKQKEIVAKAAQVTEGKAVTGK